MCTFVIILLFFLMINRLNFVINNSLIIKIIRSVYLANNSDIIWMNNKFKVFLLIILKKNKCQCSFILICMYKGKGEGRLHITIHIWTQPCNRNEYMYFNFVYFVFVICLFYFITFIFVCCVFYSYFFIYYCILLFIIYLYFLILYIDEPSLLCMYEYVYFSVSNTFELFLVCDVCNIMYFWLYF